VKINDQYPSAYLKAADLKGRTVRVTIAGVSVEKIGDDTKPVLHFVGKDKGLVLNKTNSNRIVEATGSDETEDWDGWSLVLYPCKVDFQGKRVDAIRVDDRPGASKGPGKVGGAARRPEPADVDDLEGSFDVPPAPELSEDDIPF
jgi:hypothetical protein